MFAELLLFALLVTPNAKFGSLLFDKLISRYSSRIRALGLKSQRVRKADLFSWQTLVCGKEDF